MKENRRNFLRGVPNVKKKWILAPVLLCLLSALIGFGLGFRAAPVETAAETVAETAATEPETVPETTQAETEPPRQTIDAVPQYYQTDYPYLKFGSSGGTIATSGCSLTSLAMVASYMTDHEYTPDQLVYHFDKDGLNNVEKLEQAALALHLPYEKNFDFSVTRKALEEGKVVIVLENEKSDFTTGQHFIVLTGLNENGKILINDPFRPNYYKEELQPGWENGFTDYAITKGYAGAWVFDKSVMPQDMELYDASKPETPQTRYTGYELDDEDVRLLAAYVWAQARNKSEKVQQAVAEVALNRLTSPYWGNTIRDIVYGMKGIHRNFSSAQPTMAQYRAIHAAMYGSYILPKEVYYFRPWEYNGDDMWGSIDGFYFSYWFPVEE